MRVWRPLGDTLNRLGSSKWFFALWMIPVNLFALRAGLAWLSAPGQGTSGILLELGRWGLRSLGFLCVGFYLVKRTRGQNLPWRKKLLLGMALLSWLLPQVSPFIATLFIYLQAEQQWVQTAVCDVYGLAGSRLRAHLAQLPSMTQRSRCWPDGCSDPVRERLAVRSWGRSSASTG